MQAGFSGFELIRRIRQQDSATKILVTTASNTMTSYNEAMAAGADLFMGSAFGIRELHTAVCALLPGLRPRENRPGPLGN